MDRKDFIAEKSDRKESVDDSDEDCNGGLVDAMNSDESELREPISMLASIYDLVFNHHRATCGPQTDLPKSQRALLPDEAIVR